MLQINILVSFFLFMLVLGVKSRSEQANQVTQQPYHFKTFPVTIVVNPCAVNPCLNGRCQVMAFGAYCHCDTNFIGRLCDRHPDSYCSTNPCQNGALCRSTAGFEPYQCQCVPPYIGQFCDNLEKIEDFDQIDIGETNSDFLMNQTLELLKTKPNFTNTTVAIVSNLLANVSNFEAIEKNEPKVFFEIFDKVVKSANSEKSEKFLESTQKLSQTLENYISRLNLTSKNNEFTMNTDDIAVLSYMVNNTNADAANGFAQLNLNDSSIEKITDPDNVDFKNVKASAFLNQQVLADVFDNGDQPVVSFAVYEKSTMFDVNSSRLQYPGQNCSVELDDQIVTGVISVSTNKKIVSDLHFVRSLFRTNPTVDQCKFSGTKKHTCVFWDYTSKVWNSSGCTYSITTEGLHACKCNHLTNFAVLMSFDNSISICPTCSFILKYASYAGSIASIVCLSILIIFYSKDLIKNKMVKNRSLTIGFKSMFDFYIQILISLSVSLLIMNVFYIVFSTVLWTTHGHSLCVTIGVLLHYFLLSSFAWMLSFAVLQYLTFNKTFVMIKNYYWYAALFSLGSPLIPIAIILAIDWKLYENPIYQHCWLNGYSAIFGVIVPILIIIVVNIIVFVLILKKHCNLCYNQNEQANFRNIKKQTVILGTSFVNLGITWSMAFLLLIPMDIYLKSIFAILFCLFNSLQGFFLFLIYIVLTKSKRQVIKVTAQEKFRQVRDIFTAHVGTEQDRDVIETSVSSKNTTIGYNQSSTILERVSVNTSIFR